MFSKLETFLFLFLDKKLISQRESMNYDMRDNHITRVSYEKECQHKILYI